MKKVRHLHLFFAFSITAILLLVFAFMQWPKQSLQAGSVVGLKAPAFVQIAHAQSETGVFDIAAYLDQEAGIAAYFKSPDMINLAQVRSQFRTIETEMADYIIGSVAVPNHTEHFDAHVYVHKDGWVLAYYLKADPVSKIVDVYGKTISTTKLKTVVSAVASAAGAAFTDVTYYDFRYPNATNMLFVAEDNSNGNDFTIQVPSSYGYYERSWSLFSSWGGNYSHFAVDGVNRPNEVYEDGGYDGMYYGILTASQLLPDTQHMIEIGTSGFQYGVLVVTYRVP